MHGTEEEYFFVTEGEITFFIDGKITKGKAGETAFAPRGKVHCYKNCTNQVARMLALFTPGKIEGYFDFGLPSASVINSKSSTQQITCANHDQA